MSEGLRNIATKKNVNVGVSGPCKHLAFINLLFIIQTKRLHAWESNVKFQQDGGDKSNIQYKLLSKMICNPAFSYSLCGTWYCQFS
jgi:hypothetical protein